MTGATPIFHFLMYWPAIARNLEFLDLLLDEAGLYQASDSCKMHKDIVWKAKATVVTEAPGRQRNAQNCSIDSA